MILGMMCHNLKLTRRSLSIWQQSQKEATATVSRYIVLWNSIRREDERTITARVEELARIFSENRVKGTVLDKRGFVRMCNLVNIPAYAHIESMDFEENLAVLKQR